MKTVIPTVESQPVPLLNTGLPKWTCAAKTLLIYNDYEICLEIMKEKL